MLLSVETKTTKQIEVKVPLFLHSSDKTEWLAVVSENSLLEMSIFKSFVNVSQRNIQETCTSNGSILSAINREFIECSEEEWMEFYEETLKSLSLKPVLK